MSEITERLRERAREIYGRTRYPNDLDKAADHIEAQEARIAELEKALREAVGLLKDIDLGRSIHNSRKPDQNIDGPLWAQVPRIVELSRAALSKPQTQ